MDGSIKPQHVCCICSLKVGNKNSVGLNQYIGTQQVIECNSYIYITVVSESFHIHFLV